MPYSNRNGSINKTSIGLYHTSYYTTGYTTNIRFSNIARYTYNSNFTPQTTPFTSDSNTATAPASNYMTPTQITGLSNITAISIAYYGCLALDTSGNVWYWGKNGNGNFGNGNTNTAVNPTNKNFFITPTKVTGLTNIVAISSSNFQNLALDTGGNVWFWGWNNGGQLGTGSYNYQYFMTPTQITGLTSSLLDEIQETSLRKMR